jgi:hypothetical protein
MTTQVVFNTDSNLKKKVMAKSKKLGLPMSFVLNQAMKHFASGKWEAVLVEEKFNEKTRKELDKILDDIKKGKNLSPGFDNMEEAFKYLKI